MGSEDRIIQDSLSENDMEELASKLELEGRLSFDEYRSLLDCDDPLLDDILSRRACRVREKHYGNGVFVRGLIEFTNICRNNCLYCGIRRDNKNIARYRLSPNDMIACADRGYELGFSTFVLQGGEDPYFTDDILAGLIREIKKRHPDCAVTLSLGERDAESYERLFDAGADRYLLRHETADERHYARLHPAELTLEHRLECLRILKKIGFQVGCGMMVGSPFQDTDCLVRDLQLIRELEPQMVGIGPFIPHHDTPFADMRAGSVSLTLRLLSLIRLMLPKVLLPATTALGTLDPSGREKGLMAGANVVMPNLSPVGVREKYSLYDNKICMGEEAAECLECLKRRIEGTEMRIVTGRGDPAGWESGK